MKLRLIGLFVLIAVLILSVTSVSAHGRGNNPASLGDAGWLCVVAGPHGWVHCFPPGAFSSFSSISVKVFDTGDPGAEHAPYLGTEILLRADLYPETNPPCPQDGGEPYELLSPADTGLPFYYRACHHYETGHAD